MGEKMINIISVLNTVTEWEKYLPEINQNPTARHTTRESWKRCIKMELDPSNITLKYLTGFELEQKILEYSNLIKISEPYINLISMTLSTIPHMVYLSSKDGWIIKSKGISDKLTEELKIIVPGVNVSEKYFGNNGIGTSLEINEPCFVNGIEHYAEKLRSFSCIGVPITYNDETIGALGIFVPVNHSMLSRLLIIATCVSSIELMYTSAFVSNAADTVNDFSKTSDFIATAIHDLKNPLAVISGLGQLGYATSNKEKMKNYFNRIVSQVDEMNGIVIDLLSVFKPERLAPNNVVAIIEEIIYNFKPICESKNIKLIFVNRSDSIVNMTDNLLKRAIENIINNAVQVMEHDGVIEINTILDNDSVLITIRDTADGIPEELRDNLFEAFKFSRSGGTGLGLFMAYHTITNIHKGKLWFETETGVGTTFYIKLPLLKNNYL